MAKRNTFSRHDPCFDRRRHSAVLAAPRVLDACIKKDCMEDLQVCFCPEDQEVIDHCVWVRRPEAALENVTFDVEPVHMQPGFWEVDMTLSFSVAVDAFCLGMEEPVRLCGVACFKKRSILFGGQRGVQIFRSNGRESSAAPEATLQAAEPVALRARLADCREEPGRLKKAVLITVGLFSVTSLERPAQMLVPVFNHGVPEKECAETEIDACEQFESMRFPTERFICGERGCR